ncbi:MAG: YqgE/AlgH family protein [Alphaproteobacteria bacterium]
MNIPAGPEKKRISPHLQGVILILLAVGLLWAGQHFDMTAQQAHHRLLVSTAKARGDVFEKSVVFVMHHLKSGATGIVLNKSSGGPVGADKFFTLHTPEAATPETVELKDLGVALTEGRVTGKKLLAQVPPPAWHVTVQGYAGWSGRQLDLEIDQGEWRIIPFDKDIVRLKGQAMWDAADKLADAKDKK